MSNHYGGLHHHDTFAQDWMERGRLVHGEMSQGGKIVTVTDANTGEYLRSVEVENEAGLVWYAALQRHAEDEPT